MRNTPERRCLRMLCLNEARSGIYRRDKDTYYQKDYVEVHQTMRYLSPNKQFSGQSWLLLPCTRLKLYVRFYPRKSWHGTLPCDLYMFDTPRERYLSTARVSSPLDDCMKEAFGFGKRSKLVWRVIPSTTMQDNMLLINHFQFFSPLFFLYYFPETVSRNPERHHPCP